MPASAPFSPPSPTRRILEFDGLRGIAIAMVMMDHFASAFVKNLPVGIVGVRIFFALSGFLITGVLLDCRRRIEANQQSPRRGIAFFYLRRFLRLMPVFYIAIIISVWLGLGEARSSWPWDLTYLSNAYAIHRGDLVAGVGHFWTLAIEEQFYLLWPWLIVFAPRRSLIPAITAVILIAPLFRATGAIVGLHWTWYFCTPPGASDALGLGALLALWKKNETRLGSTLKTLEIAGWTIALPLAAAGLWMLHYRVGRTLLGSQYAWTIAPIKFYEKAITDTALSLFGFSTVATLAANPAGLWARLLRLRSLVYLGTISYAIYVYHIPLKAFYSQYALPRFPHLPLEDTPSYFLLLSTAAIALATLSWFCMELPIARFKQRMAQAKIPPPTLRPAQLHSHP